MNTNKINFEIEEDEVIYPCELTNINYKLLPHQLESLKFMKKCEEKCILGVRGGILGLSMGLGKTLTSLHHVLSKYISVSENKFLNDIEITPTLVVCPKIALITWKTEIRKFFGQYVNIFVFSKKNSELIKKNDLLSNHIVLINYEYLRSLATNFDTYKKILQIDENKRHGANVPEQPILKNTIGEKLLFSIKWDTVIADESHNFSNHKNMLWKSMMCLCAYKKWCLTGTPIKNYSNDIYPQLKFLGYRDDIFNIKQFKSIYPIEKSLFFMDYEKANVKLPDVQQYHIECHLDKKQEKIYKHYLQKTDNEFNNFTIGTSTFAKVLTLFLRLRQVCIAPYIITPLSDPKSKMTEEDKNDYIEAQEVLDEKTNGLASWINDKYTSSGMKSTKIKKTIEIIKNIPKGDKIIIFTMFTRIVPLIIECIQKENIDRESVIVDGKIVGEKRANALKQFKEGNKDILFISYKVGSESLNLTEANHIILLDQWWNNSIIQQAKARVHRIGQTKKVYMYELFIPNTNSLKSIEEAMLEISINKSLEAEDFLKGNKDFNDEKSKEDNKLDANTMRELLNSVKGYRKCEQQN